MDPEAPRVEEKNMQPSGDETTPNKTTTDPRTASKEPSDTGSDKDVGGQSESDSGPRSDLLKRSSDGQGGDMEVDVATEVEPEVNSGEQSCSMMEKVSGGGEVEPPKSLDPPAVGSTKEVLAEPGSEPLGTETGPVGSGPNHNIAISQVSEVAQASGADNTERCRLGFDLNEEICSKETDDHLTERSERLIIDLNVVDDSEDKNPVIYGGEESSVDASPWQSVRLRLDLNSLSDSVENTGIPEVRQYRRRSPSQSSSSSSMQPNPIRNIDLNSNGGESVISLFGTRLYVNPNDVVPQPTIGSGFPASRTGWGFGPSMAVYGHNSFLYGPPGATSPLMGSNGAGPSQNGFDLNVERGNGGLRQLLNENGGGGSSLGGKRKEPEGGWEDFPARYKHSGNRE